MKTKISPIKDLLKFSIPLITGQVGQMLMGVGDLMVAGRYSKEVVSAVGVASAIFGSFLMLGLGFSYAFAPLLAERMGEGKKVQGYLFTIIVYSLLISLLLIIPQVIFLKWGVPYLNLPAPIVPLFRDFFNVIVCSLPFIMVYQGVKEYLQVQKDIWYANILVIVANFTNMFLNIILCFGLFGFPEMGGKGLAYATLINRALMATALVYYVRKDLFLNLKIVKNYISDAFRLGFPIAISILMEVSIFTVVTVLIGKMDVESSAAHNIIMSIGSFTFMFPLALGNATSTLIALALSDNRGEDAKAYAYSGLKLAAIFEICTTLSFILLPVLLLSIYTDKLDVIEKGKELIIFAALFQIPDGIQATLSGILRGMQVTRPVMILTMIGYWVIGLPLGIYLAYYQGMMAKGLWIGLASSLTIMAVLLFLLFLRHSSRRFTLAVEA
ncbi:MAG: MATE family efflux transporter [Bacteriovoracaceae bacterium]